LKILAPTEPVNSKPNPKDSLILPEFNITEVLKQENKHLKDEESK
jgi:hypothetical protein